MPLLDTLRALVPWRRKATTVPMTGAAGWWPVIREPFTGAWQRNLEISSARAQTFFADFACVTLIAQDIAKLPIRLVERDKDGIWNEVSNPAFSPVLRHPNHYQTRNQFWEAWITSKLRRGNAYILKERDNRRVVTALYVLNPDRVQVLIADDGSVFYRLSSDDLAGLPGDVTVPSSEIIHDRMNAHFGSPLVGVPPIWASALAATQGLNIQAQSIRLFANNARPSGLLTVTGNVPAETAAQLKAQWEQNFGGDNLGRLAVAGNDMKFVPITMNADDAQLIEQLKLTAEHVCSTYHVPPFKIGIGPLPSYNNVVALDLVYYKTCLQSLIEAAESCLDEGLGLGDRSNLGVEFDVENLLRMDSSAQLEALEKGKNYLTPNEGRKKLNLPPKPGGDSVYRQQQDFSLEALAKRDAQDDPFVTDRPAPTEPPAAPEDEPPLDDEGKEFAAWRLQKALDALAA